MNQLAKSINSSRHHSLNQKSRKSNNDYLFTNFQCTPTGSIESLPFLAPVWEYTLASQFVLFQVDPEVSQRKKVLQNKFKAEETKYSHYLTEDYQDEDVFAYFSELANLHFHECAVELAPDNIVKVTLLLPENYMLMVSFPASEPEGIPVFTLFHNREAQISAQRPLAEIVSGTQGMLQES